MHRYRAGGISNPMQKKKPHAKKLPERYGDPAHPTHPETGNPICASGQHRPNKFGDYVCIRSPIAGRTRCRQHGGATPCGVDSPHFKTGEHSRIMKALPQRMQAAYEASLNDPAILDLKSSVALIDSRILDLISRVDTKESGSSWKAVERAFADLVAAIRSDDKRGQSAALSELDQMIRVGKGDADIWIEITRLADDRRKHVETQQRLEMAGDKAVPIGELVTMMGAFLNLVQTVISNPEEKRRLSDGIERLIAPRTSPIQ